MSEPQQQKGRASARSDAGREEEGKQGGLQVSCGSLCVHGSEGQAGTGGGGLPDTLAAIGDTLAPPPNAHFIQQHRTWRYTIYLTSVRRIGCAQTSPRPRLVGGGECSESGR